jgi:hypothetical protein
MGACTKVRETSIIVSIHKLLAHAAVVSSIDASIDKLPVYVMTFFSYRPGRNVKECGNK